MPPRDWRFRVEDILEAIAKIQSYTEGMTRDGWIKDDKTFDAVVRNLEIIGEAAKNINREVQERTPDIPWSEMKGIRDVLAHQYFGVDRDVIWETIQNDLSGLAKKLKVLL